MQRTQETPQPFPAFDDAMHDSLRLSISAPTLDCARVAALLQRAGIAANTTANRTTGGDGVEPGCCVLLPRVSRHALRTRVWEPLRGEFPELRCAHVHAPATFSGCIFDFLRPSRCPGDCGAYAVT